MSNLQERKEILDSLEDSYRKDLAIHLYSTLLARRVDRVYPNGGWASWPLNEDQVPIPSTTLKYADSAVDESTYSNDIDFDQKKLSEVQASANEILLSRYQRKRRAKAAQKKGLAQQLQNVQTTELSESDEVIDSEEELPDALEEQMNTEILSKSQGKQDLLVTATDLLDENNSVKRIANVVYKQTHTNSKADLVNEIHALIQRKINEKFQKLKKGKGKSKWKNLELVPEIQTEATVQMSKVIASRVDGLLNNIETKYSTLGKLNSDRYRVCWQHILLSGLSQVDSPYESYDADMYQRLYERCEDLFENITYKYEYEEDEDEDEAEEDDIDNDAEVTESHPESAGTSASHKRTYQSIGPHNDLEHSDNNEENTSEFSDSETDTDTNHVNKKNRPDNNESLEQVPNGESRRGFDVLAYLRSLEDGTGHIYDKLRSQHLQKRQEHLRYCADLRTLFMKRIQTQRRYNDLKWDGKQKKKTRSSFSIQSKSWEQLKENAIRHGSNVIEAKNYLLEDF